MGLQSIVVEAHTAELLELNLNAKLVSLGVQYRSARVDATSRAIRHEPAAETPEPPVVQSVGCSINRMPDGSTKYLAIVVYRT